MAPRLFQNFEPDWDPWENPVTDPQLPSISSYLGEQAPAGKMQPEEAVHHDFPRGLISFS
jgi:hypothetical protein